MKWEIRAFVFVIYVCQCKAISLPEIEDFSNFLLRTSSLLRSNINPYDADPTEDDHISDYAWEESGKFEGDLILNERQRRLIVEDVAHGLSRNGLQDSTKRWPNNEVIYYIQKEHFNSDQLDAINNGIEDLSQASCVKFRPYRKGDPDAVVIQGSRRGCFSQVGYQGGYQVLNLSGRHPAGRGCFRHGTVVHELLHTLGFYHMQSSPDRDDYINVRWDNIVEPAKHNFRKYNSFSVSDFGVGYDYESVLHYGRKAFSSNGQDTLVPRKLGAQIGQRIGLSDKDTKKLNKMYCDEDSNNFEADNNSPHRHVTKKKTPKNQPFQGHGIGYQKGKTVVIKLPTSETVDLNGNKDKIADELYYFKPSTNLKDSKFAKPNTDGASEAFDRLGHILKTHVYPSQTPNLSIYKFNTDYSDFFNPNKKFATEPEIKKVDQRFDFHNTSPKPQNEYLDENPLYKLSRNSSTDFPKKDVEIVKVTKVPIHKSHFVTRPQFIPESTTLENLPPETPFKKYDYSDLYLPYTETEPGKSIKINTDGEQFAGYSKPSLQKNEDDFYHQQIVYPQTKDYNKKYEDSYGKHPNEAKLFRDTYPGYHTEDDRYKIIPKIYSEQKYHEDDTSKFIKHSEERPNKFYLQDGTDRTYDHSNHDTPENKTNEVFIIPYSDVNREYATFAQGNSDVARENFRKSFENYKKSRYVPVSLYGDTIAGTDELKSSHINSPSPAGDQKDVAPSSYHLDKYERHEPKVHEDYEYSSENSHSVESYR